MGDGVDGTLVAIVEPGDGGGDTEKAWQVANLLGSPWLLGRGNNTKSSDESLDNDLLDVMICSDG